MPRVGPYSRCRFCPLCGLETLEKDNYRQGHTSDAAEFVCRTCGFGFRINRSARVAMVDELHHEQRKLRTGRTIGDGVSPEVAQKCVEFFEGPMRKMSLRTWLRKYLPKFRAMKNTEAKH